MVHRFGFTETVGVQTSSSNRVLASFPARSAWPAGLSRSLWLEQVLSSDRQAVESAALPATADVCVVGGGFTGLWAALALKRRAPDLDVVVVEADICGGGASGRNGGFVMTAWSKFLSLRKLCGEADAFRYASACDSAIGEIGEFLRANSIDGEFNQSGWLWTATNRSQQGAWHATVEAVAQAGAHPYTPMTAEEVAVRSGSAVHCGGIFESAPAVFHPAKVARGLAEVAGRQGIVVVEQTPVREIRSGSQTQIVTAAGSIRASQVLLTTNAWTAALPEVRGALVIVSSDVVATEPATAALDRIGLEPGLSISDSRRLVAYYHRTSEDRMVFGKGGGTLAFNGRVADSFHGESPRANDVAAALHRTYPALTGVKIAQSWRGPIDYSISGLPFVFKVGGDPSVLAAAGFSGNGCGPSYVVGDALAAIAVGQDASHFPEGLRRIPTPPLPREPLRYIGGRTVRSAIARKETLEDRERPVDRLTRKLAALDPTGLVDRGDGQPAVNETAVGV